jgi:prepilin-type N-terminal cleavage/methylation domain-containing protein
MKITNKHSNAAGTRTKPPAGFSLIELLIALAIFLIISMGAVTLVQQHVPLATTVQNQVNLNIALGNVIAQMQSDAINAGSGYYQQLNNTDNPIGVTVLNCGNVTTGCTGTSGSDTLNLIAIDPNTPAAPATDSSGHQTGTPPVSCSVTNSSDVYLYPPTGTTAAALAADYHSGDYILLLSLNTSGNQFTTTKVTGTPTVVGSVVQLPITATLSTGVATAFGAGTGDPFYITADLNTARLTDTFCYGSPNSSSLVLRILPSSMITYTVSGGNLTRNGVVLASNIVSFKVGVWAINTGSSADQSSYLFNAPSSPPSSGCVPTASTNCGFLNDWPLIRSIMITVIGKTPPNPTNHFRNTFDGGAYQVQAATTILNPRNLSMRDNVTQ